MCDRWHRIAPLCSASEYRLIDVELMHHRTVLVEMFFEIDTVRKEQNCMCIWVLKTDFPATQDNEEA